MQVDAEMERVRLEEEKIHFERVPQARDQAVVRTHIKTPAATVVISYWYSRIKLERAKKAKAEAAALKKAKKKAAGKK
jgi:hypothetical protein